MRKVTATASYRRKLSREDVETGSILIDKRAWRLFPPPMEEFTVVVGGQEFHTCIVAEECSCARTGARLGVPPPHQHYHLEAGHFRHLLDFRPGRTLLVQRDPAGFYRLEMAGE
jgi:hypothetical protein